MAIISRRAYGKGSNHARVELRRLQKRGAEPTATCEAIATEAGPRSQRQRQLSTQRDECDLQLQASCLEVTVGSTCVEARVGDATFYFKPQIFRQANLAVFANGIIPRVVQNIPAGAKVAELYSGIGIMGLNAAAKASEVLCSDSNDYVTEVFDSCVDSLDSEEDRDKLFYEALPAEEAVEEGQCDDADVLLVDPPRKGLDAGVMDLLLGTHPTTRTPGSLRTLIYVSCGFEALETRRERIARQRPVEDQERRWLCDLPWLQPCRDGGSFRASGRRQAMAAGSQRGSIDQEGERTRKWENR